MRVIGSICLILVLGFFACKKTGSDKDVSTTKIPDSPPVEGSLVVVAKLMEIPTDFPPNELYNYCYIMKYQVEKVLSGTYSGTELLVGHYNPRFSRDAISDDQKGNVGGNLKKFSVGDKHYLVLNELDKVWSGAIEDEYYKDSSQRYWASWVNQL